MYLNCLCFIIFVASILALRVFGALAWGGAHPLYVSFEVGGMWRPGESRRDWRGRLEGPRTAQKRLVGTFGLKHLKKKSKDKNKETIFEG